VVDVKVSQTDSNWTDLGLQTIDIPENYYENAGPYDTIAPTNPVVANFGQPFTGTIDSFDGEDADGIVSTLDGSAGGTWLSLYGSGLSQVNYVQFTEPLDLPSGSYIALEAVSEPVPEPGTAGVLLVMAGCALRRRRAH
jgi:hypothetical protein